MKVALVHDYLIRLGGAERVLLELAKMFPNAPIYTLLYDKEKMSQWFGPERVHASFLNKFPGFWRKRQKYLLPFLPIAPETFDLRDFDLVISSSSAFAKGVVTRPKTIHINYCHNPSRFLWDYYFEYIGQQKIGNIKRIAINLILNYIRLWDRASSKRVDYFIANSTATAQRIKKYYKREAKVIYPPVRTIDLAKKQSLNYSLMNNRQLLRYKNISLSLARDASKYKSSINCQQKYFDKTLPADYFLIVSQLTPYKKIDIAIEAFNKMQLPLIIIGDGPQKRYLKKIAGSNIKILGWQSDEIINYYYQNCLAFIFPGEDDFGMAPVEAMKHGKPVLALRAGGAIETVLPAMTGEFFDEPKPEVLADGVRRLRENMGNYSPIVIRKWAEKFSTERFREEFFDYLRKLNIKI